jgi:serine/threonine protein kinase
MSKQVENYVFQEILGQGQYGQVYRGINLKTDEVVAIKQMNIEKFKKIPKLYDFIKNEIDILSQIDHPNVIRFIEILRTSNNFYLVYEYCNGGDLERLLKKRKLLPEKEANHILSQILQAFKVLINKNILHRDLKPGNVIFHNN